MVKIQVNSQGKAYYTSNGKVLLAPEGGSSGGQQGPHRADPARLRHRDYRDIGQDRKSVV